ncbi:MAG: chain-length determining protein [Bacteroidaceae bacterium]|nr:chain-length determining protein [Bacteroidaceae bacterium]
MKFPRLYRKKKTKAETKPADVNPTEAKEEFMPREESEQPDTAKDETSTPVISDSDEERVGEPAAATVPVLSEKISINAIFGCIWHNKWKYILPLVITGAVVSWLALCIPRYYKVTVMLAPEYNVPTNIGGFSGFASSLGINVGSSSGSDAIVPMFYPDLISSTDFIVPLFDIPITTKDGKYKGTYADYLKTKQKAPWWTVEMNKLKNRIAPPPKSEPRGEADPVNPFALTFEEDAIMRAIKASINCTVDKKTDVITITTTAQDPLVAALIADTVRQRLQDFIIQYRTVKARRDLEHVEKLCEKAHSSYLQKQHDYATFVDANQDLVLESFKSKERDLEDEMQLAFNTYSQLLTQVQTAKGKVQERTPAFTVLQNASVPVKHAGPQRVLMVLESLILAFIISTIVFITRDKRVRW